MSFVMMIVGVIFIQIPPPNGGPGCQGILQGQGIMLSESTLTLILFSVMAIVSYFVYICSDKVLRYLGLILFNGMLMYMFTEKGTYVAFAGMAWMGVNFLGWAALQLLFL